MLNPLALHIPFPLIAILALSLALKPPCNAGAEEWTRDQANQLLDKLAAASRIITESTTPQLEPQPPASLREMITSEEDAPPRLNLPVRQLQVAGFTTPYAVFRKGFDDGPPDGGYPLFICMHGGGGNGEVDGPHAWPVNTREFQTQIQLAIQAYEPDGIYFVPRMADDRRGRWWHKHVSETFEIVIDHAIRHWNADPDRIYLLGISEGGFGAAILAPWMADRLAGANSMAAGVGLGNPPANLRNLAFRTDVGERDAMFDRVGLATAFHEELDRLRADEDDERAYPHHLGVQAGRGHGIDYRPGVSWIAEHKRDPWPKKVVWIDQSMDSVWRHRFYWVARPNRPDNETSDSRLVAWIDPDTRTIHLEAHRLSATNTDGNRTHGMDNVAESERLPWGDEPVELLLSDELIDLDQPLRVIANGETVFEGRFSRSREVIEREFSKRPDPRQTPSASLTVIMP